MSRLWKRQVKELAALISGRCIIIFINALAFLILCGLLIKARPILGSAPLSELLFSSVWHPMKNNFGLFPFIISTVEVTLLAMIIVVPVCLLCAIYLSEYAHRRFREVARFVIDILAGKVDVRLKLVRGDVSPHHELDHTLRHFINHQVGNPRMSEYVGCNVLRNASPSCDPFQLIVDTMVSKRFVPLIEEHQHIRDIRICRVIVFPLSEVLFCHDQPDIPGFPCLKIHIYLQTIAIKDDVAPFHQADFTDTETSFVEHHDECPIHTPAAPFDHGINLVNGQ
jgi:hypothetical protein